MGLSSKPLTSIGQSSTLLQASSAPTVTPGPFPGDWQGLEPDIFGGEGVGAQQMNNASHTALIKEVILLQGQLVGSPPHTRHPPSFLLSLSPRGSAVTLLIPEEPGALAFQTYRSQRTISSQLFISAVRSSLSSVYC
ncbi:hypothetical protein JZ751_019100 [Albula glossodonta]|uniref:Uncharacterized protein n=1 Tax=Albula glossodonta TaxID=121402 RepID=A0A8T2NMI0_9TELE|nr:hypothetical protein JZ751_019100 [Albula glossodonta]